MKMSIQSAFEFNALAIAAVIVVIFSIAATVRTVNFNSGKNWHVLVLPK